METATTNLNIDDNVNIVTGTQTFRLPLADTLFEMAKLTKGGPPDEQLGEAIQKYLLETANMPVSKGQALNLYQQLELEYARKKKAWQSDMSSIAGLPASTAG
jgi:hypothetical protein